MVSLSVGTYGEAVELLHSKLRQHGFDIPKTEVDRGFFGPSTRDAVQKCQAEHGLSVTGVVDEATIAALEAAVARASVSPDRNVTSPAEQPPSSVTSSPRPDASRPADALEIESRVGEPPRAAPGDVVVAASASAGARAETDQHRVEGRIFFDNRVPAADVTVRLYSRGFGGADTRLAEIRTDAQGSYSLSYDPGGKEVNLEVRVLDADGKEVPLSSTKFNAGKHEVLNLVAPASLRPLAAEYQRLTADLDEQLDGLNKLADAREKDERQDITLLHQATGWDARLIALAATASKLNSATDIPQDALYALFRAGLPTDKQRLARVSVETVEKALDKAKEAGIFSLDEQQIAEAKRVFENFARTTRRAEIAPGTRSSFGELLGKSELAGAEQNVFEDLYFAHRGAAAELWQKVEDRGISAAKIEGLRLQGKLAYLTLNNVDLVEPLQEDIGSPGNLVRLVDQDFYQSDAWKTLLNEIAENNERPVQELIPPVCAGEEIADPLDAYAADLARKVRLSFPTYVVGRMIEKGELNLGEDGDEVNRHVRTFLQKAGELGFELGRVPVDTFIRENHEELFGDGTPEEVEEATIHGVKKLQRLYQLTPTDEALKVVLDQGFTSAYDIVAFPYEVFLERFGGSFPSREEAQLVYRKAQQVSAVTHNVLTAANQMDSSPAMYAVSPPTEVRENAKNELIKHFPTMESLFGSLDFCECEHCRSVLSPAAYLVDLLQFLDPEEQLWDSTLSDWKEKHNNAPYPFKNQSEWETFLDNWRSAHNGAPYPFKDESEWNAFLNDWRNEHPGEPDPDPEARPYEILDHWSNVHSDELDPDTEKKPYDVLVERRPDLPHLPLTCENTNTALPYIDVVNEILEYYVANGNLDAGAAHDTGAATTPELLAEPQNIRSEAYEVLKQARYPLGLPFDLWLETVRRVLDHFETPLWRVLEVFRPTDELFAPSASPQAYYRAAVFTEYLGISPDEYGIFADPDPLAKWFELYGYATEAEALAALRSAKILARRLGASYKELIEVVRTGFVNPRLDKLTILRKLDVNVDEVFRYKGHAGYPVFTPEELAAFEERLDDLTETFNPSLDPSGFNARRWLEGAWENGEFNQILLLADPDAGCDFDETILRYADGTDAEPLIFLKINLFVRLWRKLGWTMEETDRTLQVFLPRNLSPLTATNLGEALKTALLYLAHLKTLNDRVRAGKDSRLKLLTLWSNLPTIGKNPLYPQLFLTRSVLKNDPVFDDPLGNYLSKAGIEKLAETVKFEATRENVLPADKLDPAAFATEPAIEVSYDEVRQAQRLSFRDVLLDTKKEQLKALNPSPVLAELLDAVQAKAQDFFLIKGHLLALQGALNLTADEIGRILDGAGKDLDTAELSLDNVSLLYRYGLLAKALKLPVRDLIALKGLSGLDPFKPLSSDPVGNLAEDHPFGQTLRFVEVVEKVKKSGFRVEDLAYVLRHRFDPVGKYRPNPDTLLALVKSLAADHRRLQAEHAVPADPATLTDELLRQELALVLSPDAVATFLGMWTGTVEYEAVQENVPPADKLDPAAFTQEPAIQVSYDEVRQVQRLIFQGVMLDAEKNRLKAAHSSPVFAELLDKVQGEAKDFFEKHLQESTIGGQAVGFLEAGDFEMLFAPIPDELTDAEKEDRMRTKRAALAALLPFVQQKLARQLIVQTLASNLNADPVLTEALLANAGLLTDPGQPGKPLLDAFPAAGERGLSATFFSSADGTGAPLETRTVAAADTTDKPTGANSARFEGYLEVPAAGAYRFFLVFGKKDAQAELRLAHLPDPLLRGEATDDGAKISQFIELKPGVPYRFTLDVHNLGGGDVALLVQGENLPEGALNRLPLYPQAAVERIRRAHMLLAKTLQLIQGLGLSEREVRHVLTHAADFGGVDLSKLPTREADDSPAGAEALFEQFIRLADYARLKRDLAGDTDDLVAIFENALRIHAASAEADQAEISLFDDLCKRVADLTRRDAATVQTMARHLGFSAQSTPVDNELHVKAPDFAQEKGIWRLWEALQVVEKLGLPVDKIVDWTEIVSSTIKPEERFVIARDLRNTVKARHEPENWQRIAQAIFDKLRQRQRDALVAYIMHRNGFERIEQLFEYFLVDPGMEPVVQTSRLRLAISSVQLFIQRCLLNLEPKVRPSAIESKHWQWMKRYRVWEANRKIFLFPENWLEPEFRDDKTHLFQELEGALLQGDVSNDLAEDAFYQYLTKLEELARLDIVAMYCEEKPLDPASNTLHVIGRTYSQPHQYFYRRYAHQRWSPWEQVAAEIEGDHLVAVVWRERLHLFWVTFLEKVNQDANAETKIEDMATKYVSEAVQKEVEVQLNWSEYFQGQWATRESSGFDDANPITVGHNFDSRQVRLHVSKETDAGEEGAVKIHLHFDNAALFRQAAAAGGAGGVTYRRGFYFGPLDLAFRVVSKNSQPQMIYGEAPHQPRYTRDRASNALQVTFVERIATEHGEPSKPTPSISKDILQIGDLFSLLFCGNRFELPTAEIGALVGPFFYQDNQHTFFVQPSLTETPIKWWEEWIVVTPLPDVEVEEGWWERVPIQAEVPVVESSFSIDLVDPLARFEVQVAKDWVTNPATALEFDGRLIGQGGGSDFEVLSANAAVGNFVVPVKVNLGSELMSDGALVVTPGRGSLDQGDVTLSGDGLNVVGGGGLNPVLLNNLDDLRGSDGQLSNGFLFR